MPVITKQELIDASVDAQTLEDVVNASATPGTLTSRLGTPLKTLAKIIEDLSLEDIGAGAAALINGRIDDLETQIGDGLGFDNLLTTRADDSNIFPDPFFANSTLTDGYLNKADSPYFFSGAWLSLGYLAGRKYPTGKVLVRPNANVSAPYIYVSLDKLGLVEGETFRIAVEARRTTGTGDITTGTFLTATFMSREGTTAIGAVVPVIAPSVPTPLNENLTLHSSADMTVPAGAGRFRLHAPSWGIAEYAIESVQIVRGVPLDKPIQNYIPENLNNRLINVEAANMQSRKNNLLLRRTAYSALSVVRALGGITTVAAFAGYGQSFLASACPVGGFNAVQDSWKWVVGSNSPVEIIVEVKTSSTGTNPLNGGELIAIGKIGLDPLSGSGDGAPVQLFEPDGVTPKTVMPADLGDLMGISFIGVNADGGQCSSMNVSRQNTDLTYIDPADTGYRIPVNATNGFVGVGGGWSSIGTGYSWGPKLVTLTDPLTSPTTASAKLANSVGQKIAEPPLLQAVPQKMWCTVGKSTWLHYATIQMRNHLTTGFYGNPSASIPANSGNFEDGWKHTPTAAGSFTVTLQGEANGVVSATKACIFSSVAAATGAGTVRSLMLGDSMVQSAGMQARLNALATADGITSIVNMGTVGVDPVKNEGYSGSANGIFFTPGNPFYNPTPATFDFNYYMTNLAVADPTHVTIASGFWNAAYATSDGDAVNSAASWVAQIELMITSIHAHNAAINIGIWTPPVHPYDGQDGENAQITQISVQRRRRNMIIFGEASIAAFSGREGSKVYSVPCGQTMNPQTQHPRSDFTPVDASVAARVVATPYATYAALIADLTPGDGTIVKVTNGAGFRYYVKVWGAGLGHWRLVTEGDGFSKMVTDSIHPSTGFNAAGDLLFSWMKATL